MQKVARQLRSGFLCKARSDGWGVFPAIHNFHHDKALPKKIKQVARGFVELRLIKLLPDHECFSPQKCGWGGIKNGETRTATKSPTLPPPLQPEITKNNEPRTTNPEPAMATNHL